MLKLSWKAMKSFEQMELLCTPFYLEQSTICWNYADEQICWYLLSISTLYSAGLVDLLPSGSASLPQHVLFVHKANTTKLLTISLQCSLLQRKPTLWSFGSWNHICTEYRPSSSLKTPCLYSFQFPTLTVTIYILAFSRIYISFLLKTPPLPSFLVAVCCFFLSQSGEYFICWNL